MDFDPQVKWTERPALTVRSQWDEDPIGYGRSVLCLYRSRSPRSSQAMLAQLGVTQGEYAGTPFNPRLYRWSQLLQRTTTTGGTLGIEKSSQAGVRFAVFSSS